MRKYLIVLPIAVSLLLVSQTGFGQTYPEGAVVVSGGEDIQKAIDSLPSAGGTVYVKAGQYRVARGIHINRSNVGLIGEPGTKIILEAGVRQPVILVGTDKRIPGRTDVIKNIHISTLEIDGNKDYQCGQWAEYDPSRCADKKYPDGVNCWIRNNGIDVRRAHDIHISHVNVHDARSGGIVISNESRRVSISHVSSHHNYYDGIGVYTSEDIRVLDFHCYQNGSAGLSLDNKNRFVSFNAGFVKNNGDVGIFIRDSSEVSFHNIMIAGNSSDGCFMSHQEPGNNTGVQRLLFSGCSFLSNKRFGIWLDSTTRDSCDNNVISCVFQDNYMGCIYTVIGASLQSAANICR